MKKIILTIDAKILQDPAIDKLFKELGINHKLKVDTAEAQKGVDGIVNKIAQAFMKGGLVANGIDQAFKVIRKINEAIIQPAQEMEQYRLRLNALYGSVEDATKAFEKFQEVAVKTPATLGEVVQAGANLKAFGMDAENVLGSVTDLAAFMGINVVEASQAVGRAFAGGAGAAIVLRERGILELVKSFAKVDDLSKLSLPQFREALLGAMQDPALGIAGAADILSESYTGAMANMEDSIYMLRAEIGGHLTPIITEAVNTMAGLIEVILGVDTQLKRATKSATDQRAKFETLVITYERLHQTTNRTGSENKLYKQTIDDLIRLYPNYFKNVDLEKDKWDKIAKSINGARSALQNYLNAQIHQAVLEDSADEMQKLQKKIIELEMHKSSIQAEMRAAGQTEKDFATSWASVQAAGAAAPGMGYPREDLTWGGKIAEINRQLTTWKNKETELLNEQQKRIKTAEKLYSVNVIAPTDPGSGGSGSGSGGGGGGGGGSATNYTSALADANAAQAELRKIFADDRDLLEIEMQRRRELIVKAYGSEGAEAIQTFNELWELSEEERVQGVLAKHGEIGKKAVETYIQLYQYWGEEVVKIAEREAEEELRIQEELAQEQMRVKQELLSAYDAEIQRLSNLKTIGALSYEELTRVMRDYAEQIKEVFGEMSDEYASALEAMRLAQLRIGDTMAEQWRQQNATFLSGWNALTSTMVTGWNAAYDAMFDKELEFTDKIANVRESMKNQFLSIVGNMVAEYIQARMTELAIHLTVEESKQAAILATLGVQQSSFVASIALALKGAFAGLFEAIGNIWKWWTEMIPPPYSVAAAIATGAGMIAAFTAIKKQIGFAEGGLISGPGSETSDSIPIMASDGEYVVNARAVRQPGILPLLQQINSLAHPNLPFSSPAFAYAAGGQIRPYPAQAFNELVQEVKNLRADIYKAQPTIVNHAPNAIEIYKKSETGRKLYKGY